MRSKASIDLLPLDFACQVFEDDSPGLSGTHDALDSQRLLALVDGVAVMARKGEGSDARLPVEDVGGEDGGWGAFASSSSSSGGVFRPSLSLSSSAVSEDADACEFRLFELRLDVGELFSGGDWRSSGLSLHRRLDSEILGESSSKPSAAGRFCGGTASTLALRSSDSKPKRGKFRGRCIDVARSEISARLDLLRRPGAQIVLRALGLAVVMSSTTHFPASSVCEATSIPATCLVLALKMLRRMPERTESGSFKSSSK